MWVTFKANTSPWILKNFSSTLEALWLVEGTEEYGKEIPLQQWARDMGLSGNRWHLPSHGNQ